MSLLPGVTMTGTMPIVAALVLSVPLLCMGMNPIVPNVGMADPHMHFFNDTYVLFATHDYSNNNTGFRMDNWWVWSSTDLVNWEQASIVRPEDTCANKSVWQQCWATDGALVNGSQRWLSNGSVWLITNGACRVILLLPIPGSISSRCGNQQQPRRAMARSSR